jgi:hypothetical protein
MPGQVRHFKKERRYLGSLATEPDLPDQANEASARGGKPKPQPPPEEYSPHAAALGERRDSGRVRARRRRDRKTPPRRKHV